MDDNPTDISRTRGAGHQDAVWSQFEVRVFVGIMDVRDDLLWVQQDNEIMGMEPVSATPIGDRNMQTSMVLASDQWSRLAGLIVPAYSGIAEQMTLASGNLACRNESRSGTASVMTTPDMRAMDSRKVATRSAGLFVWKRGIVGMGCPAGWLARTESRIVFRERV
jgi:hypothetical protein